jgi:hypothetical protein
MGKRIFLTAIILVICSSCSKQYGFFSDLLTKKANGTVSLKGRYGNDEINTETTSAYAILNSDYIMLQFNQGEDQLGEFMNFDGLRLLDLPQQKLDKYNNFTVSKELKTDDGIYVELALAYTCGGPSAESGIVYIDRFDKESISGRGDLYFPNNDSLTVVFDVPVWNNLPEIPDENRLLSDDYPDDTIKFGEITLIGTVKGTEINDLCKGKITLDKSTFEIDAYTNTDLNKIEIELFSPSIDKKLDVTTFKLFQNNDNLGLLAKMKLLFQSKILAAEWEDFHPTNPSGENSPVEGDFIIHAIAQNGVSGEFNIRIIEKDNSTDHLRGTFKLPIK